MTFKNALHERWRGQGGYREFLALSFPLMLSSASWSIQNFVERMFLAWYSPVAIAAATPAGILNFTLMSIFIGTAGYTGTFAAQYHGAGMHERIGHALWQGIFVAFLGAVIILMCIPLAGPVFAFVGHDAAVQRHEVEYFQILCLASFPVIAAAALGSSFTGMGRPWSVMIINALTTMVSLAAGYGLIFGRLGFPELGIRGAAMAAIISSTFALACYLVLMTRPAIMEKYHTLTGCRFDRVLFLRIMRFGFPSGIQFALDMAGVTIFVLLIGRLGTVSLAATNIAMNINSLASMPMIGSGYAISVLMGQYMGMNRPDLGQKSTYSGLHVTLGYLVVVALAYALLPQLFIAAFSVRSHAASFTEISSLTAILLRFVGIYSVFGGMSMIFAAALKGAGDTRFVMGTNVLLSACVVIPTYIAVVHFQSGIIPCWTIATIYIMLVSLIFILRFLGGTWKGLRIIEGDTPAKPDYADYSESLGGS